MKWIFGMEYAKANQLSHHFIAMGILETFGISLKLDFKIGNSKSVSGQGNWWTW